ncbi:glutamine ABC transporter substrate-binding protein GlnH [Desulfonatronum sp. SC1]|uniref:glutamine ABC transporter substrate-binding protein GlnH n=1 Tax=Desulfonatronum sp. SC1 TaxID=2109626 RepID=UPI000D318061|nr:glutamine ABC transporter substrate-binding protein GlnH [Desulfonatronum sp. SC1]PTN35966.1 glutamine ABC transporter substrate-binding protein GlnH [Desulfonatronum sp. SC1]
MKRLFGCVVVALFLTCGLLSGPAAAKKLVVAVDTAFVPFEFRDPKTGEYTGFDIDLWAAIAEVLGVEYELQPMDFSGIVPALQTGSIDAALAGITITSAREKVVDFSHPYYDSGLTLMVLADNEEIKGPEDVAGKRIAVRTGTTSDNHAPSLNPSEIIKFPNIEQAYMELRAGRVDVAMHDTPNVLYYIQTAGEGAVKAVGPRMQAQSYGIGFPLGSKLRNDVNVAFLELVESGRYAEIYRKWFGQDPSPR